MRYVCIECGLVYEDDEIIKFDGEYYCDDCYDKLPNTDGSPNKPEQEINTSAYEPVSYAIKEEKKHWWNRDKEEKQ